MDSCRPSREAAQAFSMPHARSRAADSPPRGPSGRQQAPPRVLDRKRQQLLPRRADLNVRVICGHGPNRKPSSLSPRKRQSTSLAVDVRDDNRQPIADLYDVL